MRVDRWQSDGTRADFLCRQGEVNTCPCVQGIAHSAPKKGQQLNASGGIVVRCVNVPSQRMDPLSKSFGRKMIQLSCFAPNNVRYGGSRSTICSPSGKWVIFTLMIKLDEEELTEISSRSCCYSFNLPITQRSSILKEITNIHISLGASSPILQMKSWSRPNYLLHLLASDVNEAPSMRCPLLHLSPTGRWKKF